MLGFRSLALFLLIAIFACGESAFAYVRTMSASGRPLFWAHPVPSLRGNPMNTSGLSEAQVGNLFSSAFSSWQVPESRAGFTYTQSSAHPLPQGQDAVNSVFFATQGGRNLDWGVVAVTEVLYYVSSGQVAEADMIFNDRQFRFTANAGDTGQTIGGRTAIYLPDVATHEAGHALGFDHSLVNLSTMIYTAFSGQFSLGSDEASGMRSVYPNGARSGGTLSGIVAGTQGGIFGAQVSAVNLATGKVEAGTLSSPDGSFSLGDVPAGKYAVMMEPFGADISSVSGYFQNVDHRFCSGSRFRRRFYSACGAQGLVSVIDVSAGSNTSLGTLAPSCSQMGNPGGPPNSIFYARELSASGGAAFGTMRTSEAHFYRVRNVAGQLRARAQSFTLYSPIDVSVEILDSAGNSLPGASSTPDVQSPMPGGKINYDALAEASVATGDYLIKVTTSPSRIPSSAFSAGWELMDTEGHYLLSLGVNDDYGPTGASDMSACVGVRNISQAATFRSVASSQNDSDRAAGCGVIDSDAGDGGLFYGGMMQVLLVALAVQAALLALRRRSRAVLVRKRP